MPFRSSTILGETVKAITDANFYEIILVTGSRQKEIGALVKDFANLKIVHNPDYQDGMTSTIKTGVQAASLDTDGYAICLGDMPTIGSSVYDHLIHCFGKHSGKPPVVVPVYKKSKGNPVIFPEDLKDQILNHKEKEGCRGVLEANINRMFEVHVSSESILLDIDTKEDYKRIH